MVIRVDPQLNSMNFHLSRKPLTIEAHVSEGKQHSDQVTECGTVRYGEVQGGQWEDEAVADDVDQVKQWKENQQSARKYAVNKLKCIQVRPNNLAVFFQIF